MTAHVTSPALIAAEAAANNQNTPGSRPCNLESTDSRVPGVGRLLWSPFLVAHDRIAHAPPDPKQQEHGDRSRNDQHGHRLPDRACRSGHGRYQERSRDGTDLIKCFVYAEAVSQPDCGSGVRQQGGLGWATDRLANPLPQDQNAGYRQPGAGEERSNGQGRNADHGEGVSGEGERPIAPAAVGPRPGDNAQHQGHGLTRAADQPHQDCGGSE